MTELEGAILGVLRRTGGSSAYFVRKVFLKSLSEEWSGSAGAVYPAIARMKKTGFLKEHSTSDRRGTKIHVLTSKGKAAHDKWLCDVRRATGPGLDPFRARAGVWLELTLTQKRPLMTALKKELKRQRAELTRLLSSADKGDKLMLQLHIALLESRLHWLEQQ